MKKMIMTALAAALLVSPAVVSAQALKYNCTTTGCNFISDPFPPTPSVQPNTCKLVVCNTTDCTANGLKVQTVVGGALNAAFCNFPNQVFNPGTYRVAAIAVAADGSESPLSNILAFTSSAGAPPAPVLKITSPVVH